MKKEAEALCKIFDIRNSGQGPYIAATKSLTGHEFWMAGASQVVYALIMSGNGFIAGHPNFENGSKCSANLNIPRETIPSSPKTILCNAAGFGGVNAALLLKVKDAL